MGYFANTTKHTQTQNFGSGQNYTLLKSGTGNPLSISPYKQIQSKQNTNTLASSNGGLYLHAPHVTFFLCCFQNPSWDAARWK